MSHFSGISMAGFVAIAFSLSVYQAAAGETPVRDIYKARIEQCVDRANRETGDYNQLHHKRAADCLNGGSLKALGASVPVMYWPSYARDTLGWPSPRL